MMLTLILFPIGLACAVPAAVVYFVLDYYSMNVEVK